MKLPELQEAILGPDDLTRFCAELSERASHLNLRFKDSVRGQFSSIESLAALNTLLIERRIWGAQIDYQVDGERWLDTLLVKAEGIQLVRMRK